MKIYKQSDFKGKKWTYFQCFMAGHKYGETAEEYKAKEKQRLKETGVQPFYETDEKIELFKIYRINGKDYIPGMTSDNIAIVEELDGGFSPDPNPRYGESTPHCPYCGEEYSDCYEDEEDCECGNCGGIFNVLTELSYDTEPVRAPEVTEI